MMDTHFTISPHTCNCVERAATAFNVMKALAGSTWGFTTKTLVVTNKAIVRLILNYTTPIWFTQVSSTHLDKLEVTQNKALRITTGCHERLLCRDCGPPLENAPRINCYSSSMLAPSKPCTPVISSTLPPQCYPLGPVPPYL